MKKISLILFMFLAFAFVGCDSDNVVLDPRPAAPQGLYSVTGNSAIYFYFNGPYESDIKQYIILRSFEEFTNYVEIGIVQAVSNPNLDLLIYEYADNAVVNGITYYYAVRSVDFAGQRSELSAESIFDTPRPDGETDLYPFQTNSLLTGFSFLTKQPVPYNSTSADFFLKHDDISGIHSIEIGNSLVNIQDMGFSDSFDDISYAPQEGWSSFTEVELILGHTYVIWTDTENYAKIRPTQIFTGSKAVHFQWAYQTTVNNPELAPESDKENNPQANAFDLNNTYTSSSTN